MKGKVGAGQAVTLTIPGLPAGTNPQRTANLSFTKGQTISNMVIVAVGTDAKVTVYNKPRDRERHRADLTGYFTG